MSQHSLPPTNPHPSLATSYNTSAQLPQIQAWLRNPSITNSATGASPGSGGGIAPSHISAGGVSAGAGASSSTSAASSPSAQSRGASVSSVGDRHIHHPSSSTVGGGQAQAHAQNGQGQRSPQDVERLLKRSDSGHSDFHTSPSRGAARNASLSPSPPPDGPSSRAAGGSSSGSDAGHA